MLGWTISIFPFESAASTLQLAEVSEFALGLFPPTADRFSAFQHLPSSDAAVVSWGAGVAGLAWVDGLVQEAKGISIWSHGYPMLYLARARDVAEAIATAGSTMADGRMYAGLIGVEPAAGRWGPRAARMADLTSTVRPGEWVLVTAWDES